MRNNFVKKALSIAIVSISIVANMATPVNANEIVPATGKFCPPVRRQWFLKQSFHLSLLKRKLVMFLNRQKKENLN